MIEWIKMNSPIGDLYILSEEESICGISWDESSFKKVANKKPSSSPKKAVLLQAKMQLLEYFNGERDVFDLALSLIHI
mgnify:FL=1